MAGFEGQPLGYVGLGWALSGVIPWVAPALMTEVIVLLLLMKPGLHYFYSSYCLDVVASFVIPGFHCILNPAGM